MGRFLSRAENDKSKFVDVVPVAIVDNENSAGIAMAVADGADVTQGAKADAPYVDADGSDPGSIVSLLKAAWIALKGTLSATISPIRTDATSRSGTITLGATAQELMAANVNRNGWSIQNQSNDYIWVRSRGSGGVTNATQDQNSLRIAPGQLYETPYVSTYAISIIGPTTGQAFWAREW